MKKCTFLFAIVCTFLIEIAVLLVYAFHNPDFSQDMVAVNEIMQSVQNDWDNIMNHKNHTDADYVVLDKNGEVLYRTKAGLSESIHAAVAHKDTILELEKDETAVGKLIIWNYTEQMMKNYKQTIIFVLVVSVFIQFVLCSGYLLYLRYIIIKPFWRLSGFAERVAKGNFDIPLEMDRKNLFGAFTESFDLMRSELKRARIAEAEANAAKKELVAKLSHDIKTPVASIKAASEVGYAIAENEKTRENYEKIIQKTDQINILVTNLFTATLEELRRLSVIPEDMESREIKSMLENSDYLHRAKLPVIPDCILSADRLRLQQVFDNIFANSYKYADTEIEVSVKKEMQSLLICVEDYGKGVESNELPALKEKYMRGNNAGNIEGAGLGLYISDSFMKEMKGELLLENGKNGLRVIVRVAFSGI